MGQVKSQKPYRIIDPTGREVLLDRLQDLETLVQRGELTPDTMIFDPESNRWIQAHRHPAYRDLATIPDDQSTSESWTVASDPAASDDRDCAIESECGDREVASDEPSVWREGRFRVAQILAVLGTVTVAMFMAAQTDELAWSIFALIGFVIGTSLGVFAISGILLVWSRRSMPFIPFGMLAIVLLTAYGHSERMLSHSDGTSYYLGDIVVDKMLDRTSNSVGRMSAQVDEMESIIDRWEREYMIGHLVEGDEAPATWAGEVVSPPSSGADAPSGSVDERALWAEIQVMEAMEELTLAFMEAHGLTDEPAGWLEPDYFVNTSRYPHVADYLVRHRACTEDVVANYEGKAMRRVDEILDRARLPQRERSVFRNNFLRGFRESSLENTGMADLGRGFVDSAEELHRILLANEHLTYENPTTGLVEIRDPAVENRVFELLDEIELYADKFARRQDEIMTKARGILDEMRQQIR